MTQEECPFRSSRVLHDDKGDFHLCNREEGDCECIPRGCPYLIAKNSKLNLPDLPGYVQINNKEGEKSEIPTSLEETAEISFDEARALTEDYRDFLAKGLTENRPRPIGPHWFCEYAKNRFIAGAEWQKEQKPAEWSEEDADILNCCISSIEEAKENRYAYKETDGDTSYDREIAWLKSLRPSWKPSEEQMEALLSTLHPDDPYYCELRSLYKQLKKLGVKEEPEYYQHFDPDC